MIFWQSGAQQSGIAERKQMITANHPLPISTQAKLLNISRGTVYYLPKPASSKDLAIMRQLDELHLQHPTMGARMLRDQLDRQGFKVGRRHVSTLMKKMGVLKPCHQH
jgi:putative transposase